MAILERLEAKYRPTKTYHAEKETVEPITPASPEIVLEGPLQGSLFS
jgi:hypothetical protein